MSKRSNFEKIPKDFYATTDPKAVPPKFIDYIRGKTYAEPCCGEGDLVDLLADIAVCRWESDIENRGAGKIWDAMCLTEHELEKCELIITNPPYTKDVLLPMIDHFISLRPTWLLLPSDLAHNIYFKPYMGCCSRIISVGRLRWFKDSKHTSTENFCWYHWASPEPTQTVLHGRS